MSLPIRRQEGADLFAGEMELPGWRKVAWRCEVDVNLAGCLGQVKEPMPAKDVFKRAFVSARPADSGAT